MAFFSRKAEELATERRALYLQHREELVRVVVECHLFDTIDPNDPNLFTKLARRNYALELLNGLGVLQDKTLPELVDKMLQLDYTSEEEQDG